MLEVLKMDKWINIIYKFYKFLTLTFRKNFKFFGFKYVVSLVGGNNPWRDDGCPVWIFIIISMVIKFTVYRSFHRLINFRSRIKTL